MMAPPDETLKEKEAKGTLLYCIDVSGSMGSTVQVPELQSELLSGSNVGNTSKFVTARSIHSTHPHICRNFAEE